MHLLALNARHQLIVFCRYQDRGLPFCYVGYFDGMDEGSLRANVIEAKINDVGVK